jgi:hypothetical protein
MEARAALESLAKASFTDPAEMQRNFIDLFEEMRAYTDQSQEDFAEAAQAVCSKFMTQLEGRLQISGGHSNPDVQEMRTFVFVVWWGLPVVKFDREWTGRMMVDRERRLKDPRETVEELELPAGTQEGGPT